MSVMRFVLRLPSWLHQDLTSRAAARALSLNEYCVRKLGGPEPPGIAHPDALDLRARADAVTGHRLVGIIVHGSWARGEARTTSDVDVLVVVERQLRLTRALYRAWDLAPLRWEGRAVDAHFVHLPEDAPRAGGVWCEVAVGGTVVYEADGRIQRALGEIRRAVADGRLVRKLVHGQPYWTVAA